MTMLITNLKPAELWGKKVYDASGRFLGHVVVIASRKGVVRKVVVQGRAHDQPIGIIPPATTGVDDAIVLPPGTPRAGRPRLELLH
jgi:sporulation protein YlmC with PRC-barrel domain